MIKPIPLLEVVSRYHFVPQDVIREGVVELAKRFGLKVWEGEDDLDTYEGAAAVFDGLPFTVMHYRGHPENTSTIYLPFEIKDVEVIAKIISSIAAQLKLSPEVIVWQRKDNPEL